MIRSLAAATLVVLLAAPTVEAQARRPVPHSPSANAALDRCDKRGGAHPERLGCVTQVLDREDARLDRAYKAALAPLKPPQQASLRASQKRWIKDRDSQCRGGYGGGGQAAIYANTCLAQATETRADELERRLRR
jgi:uncharacterized protein YecT (DUF1311 family)